MISGLFASHELTHQIDQWLLEEAGELEGGSGTPLLPLQFRAAPWHHARHTSNGGGSGKSGMVARGIGGGDEQVKVCLPILALLSACAATYPGGAVKTEQDAMTIASRECDVSGHWKATLSGDTWQVVWRLDGAFIVIIDARTGKTTGCTVVTK